MQRIFMDGLTLHYKGDDQASAALIQQACEKSVLLLREYYGLGIPNDCHIYVMTSWPEFIFASAPWPWKVVLAVTLPLWAFRAKKIWLLAGGWEQSYGPSQAVGVKPPHLIQSADKSLGDRIFIRGANAEETVQRITCHELTHAFCSHLKLPIWLKEGLAMVMVDKFSEGPTVRYETITALERSPDEQEPRERKKMNVGDEDALIDLYARGYWQTRYIEETQPQLLKILLSRRYPQHELESLIAAAYGKGSEGFWGEMNKAMVSHFEQEGRSA